jgi:hypothetical protein
MPSWIEMETSLIPREKQEWRKVDGKFCRMLNTSSGRNASLTAATSVAQFEAR